MELVYDTPLHQSKRLEGFTAGQNSDIYFPRVDGWEQTSRVLCLDSGFHNAVLSISHLKNSEDSFERLPSTLDFASKTSRYAGIDWSEPAKDTTSRVTSLASERGVILPTPLDMTSDSNMSTGLLKDVALTQSSQVPEMTNALHGMMHPEQITQGDTQSQHPVHMPPPGSVTATPTTRYGSPSKLTDFGTPANRETFSLLPQTQQKIEKRARALREGVEEISKKVGSRTKSGQIILCQCGHAKLEGDMVGLKVVEKHAHRSPGFQVQCSVCDTWQHLHCYGYVGDEDTRIPDKHYCYFCVLNGKGDNDIHTALQELARKRRVMYRVNEHGMRTRTDLARDLGETALEPRVNFEH